MKRYFMILVGIVLITSLRVSAIQAHETTERMDFTGYTGSFWVQLDGGNEVGISIEHHGTKNGVIPVCLYTGDLEIALRMNAQGQVRGCWAPESATPLFIIDLAAHQIYMGNREFAFTIMEQNPARTRLRFVHNQNRGGFITFKIDEASAQAELQMGDTALPLLCLNIALKQITPGRWELLFKDPFVTAYAEYVLEPAAGMMYGRGGGQ